MIFHVLKSEKVYQGRVFALRQDHIRYPDGRETNFDLVEHGGAVTMVPIDQDGQIYFVRQYRPAVGGTILELPAGTLEAAEPPEQCALRELREEVGMAAGKLQLLGEFYLAPGYSTEYMFVYLATQLHSQPLAGDEDEYLQVELHPSSAVMKMLQEGELRDAKTIAALSLAQQHLGEIA